MCNYCDNLAKKHGWENPKEGQLRVWHIPQLPMEPFHFHVNTVEEAKLLLDAPASTPVAMWQDVLSIAISGCLWDHPAYCRAKSPDIFSALL